MGLKVHISDNWTFQSKSNLRKRTKVAFFLAYFNGTKYINEQLQSIINQKQEFFDLSILSVMIIVREISFFR